MTRARDLAKGTFSGDLTVDTNTLVVDSANNNVGIRTSSPSFEGGTGTGLEINNSSGNGAHVKLTDAASGSGGTNGFDLYAFNTSGYIENYEAGSIVLRNGGTERMRIDSSGNLLVGTTSNYAENVQAAFYGASNGGISLASGTSGLSRLMFADGVAGTAGAYVGSIIYSHADDSMRFNVNGGTERMRLNSSGHLYVGGATPAFPSKLSILNGASVGPAFSVECTHTTPYGAVQFQNGNGTVGSISVYATSVSFNTSSDYRLKEDDVPMTGATERVKALRPINFAWKSDGSRVDGFLAHELADVVPEAVTGTKDAMRDQEYEVTAAIAATYDEDGNELTAAVEAVMGTRSVPDMQGIDQSKLVPLLTAALQEALNKIEAMEIRLSALEG